MRDCPYCGIANREGILFCEECGHGLVSVAVNSSATHKLDRETLGQFSVGAVSTSTDIGQVNSIIMHIRDAPESLMIPLSDEILFGREEETNEHHLDVDLIPYGALEKGVSRLHAAISTENNVITLIDAGSANGTYLNGQRLIPDQPHILRDGDEICFSRLVAHIYFK
jgi:hypothetical protein